MKKRKAPAGRPESQTPPEGVRLNKYLAANGIASRRKADEMIVAGEVMVDGKIVTELGRRVDPDSQRVEVDGVVLKPQGERHRYYLLNKPAGVVCTNDPREARPRAVDLIADRNKGRIYTVGRLDEQTVGLVILTNDGAFANRISHPRYGIDKTYRVVVSGFVDNDTLGKLRRGVRLSDFRASFSRVKLLRRSERQSTLLVNLHEGKNREIRRAFARLDLPVRDLRRVKIGPLTERGLKVGHWRPLTRGEIESLLDVSGKTASEKPASGDRSGSARATRRGRSGRSATRSRSRASAARRSRA